MARLSSNPRGNMRWVEDADLVIGKWVQIFDGVDVVAEVQHVYGCTILIDWKNSSPGHFGLRGEVQSNKGTAGPIEQPCLQAMMLCNSQPIPVVGWKIAQGRMSSSLELLEQFNLMIEVVKVSASNCRYQLVVHAVCHSAVHVMATSAV